MSTVFDNDVLIHRVMTPGLDGSGMSIAEYSALRSDVTTLLARPSITSLNAIPNVTAPSPSTGQVLTWNGSAWVNAQASGAIQRVQNQANTVGVDNVNAIIVQPGITLTTGSSIAYLGPNWGPTGSLFTVARGDHYHDQHAPAPLTFAASGSLSGGTRSLVSGSVSGLSSARAYTISAKIILDVRGEGGGAGTHVLKLTIGTNVATRPTSRTVSGVDRELTLEHSGEHFSGVTSVAVSASLEYSSGDPVNVGAGRVVFNVKPWR